MFLIFHIRFANFIFKGVVVVVIVPQSVKITWGQSWHDKTSDTFSSFVSPIWGKICVLQALDWILLEHSERKTVPPYRIGPVKIEWQESILNFACFFWYHWRRNYEVGEVVCKSTLCCINQRCYFKKIFIVFCHFDLFSEPKLGKGIKDDIPLSPFKLSC